MHDNVRQGGIVEKSGESGRDGRLYGAVWRASGVGCHFPGFLIGEESRRGKTNNKPFPVFSLNYILQFCKIASELLICAMLRRNIRCPAARLRDPGAA
jgi:hypothetical protein